VPIIAIGAYPKIITNFYDSTTVVVNAKVRSAQGKLALIKQNPVLSQSLTAPQI
jgi:NAD(P)H-quinone oxidoreductase subunit 4